MYAAIILITFYLSIEVETNSSETHAFLNLIVYKTKFNPVIFVLLKCYNECIAVHYLVINQLSLSHSR